MRNFAFLVLLFSSITLLSQNCNNSLSGIVSDIHDGQLLTGVTLIVAETDQAVQTNFDGTYSFSNLCNATYYIQVSHPYCLTKGFTVKVSGDTNKSFKLEHHLEELNQITIEGKAYADKSKTLLEHTINKDELERFSSGSVGDALKSLSGVSALNTGSTVVKPIIHGLHSSRVAIINNGVRMEDQEWGAEHAPNVDINSVSNLSVIKGAGALQFSGDAVGGVIIAETSKVPVKDSLYGKSLMTTTTNGRGFSLNSKLTKSYKNGWYTTLQGTLKRFGDFEAPGYVLSNTGMDERNGSIKVGFNRFDYGFEGYYSHFKNEIGILSASHLGGAKDQVRAISSDKPLIIKDFTYAIKAPSQDVTHHLATVKGFKRFENFGKLNFQYDFQRNNRLEFDIRRGDDKDKPASDLELVTHTILVDIESRLSDQILLKSGLMTKYQHNFANPSTGVRRLIPDYEMYDSGLYFIIDYQLNDHLLLEAGGRYDYSHMDVFKFYKTSFWDSRNYNQRFSEIVVEDLGTQILTNPQPKFNNGSGTLGATYTFGEDYKLFFNYSIASRAPNPSELFSEGLHHSASRIEQGDLSFKAEIAHKVALTLQSDSDQFSFNINPYINTISDFIVNEPTEIRQTLRGNFQVWEYRQTNAQLLGVDVDASYTFAENYRINSQFSLVKGYDRTLNTSLIGMPPVNISNEIVYQNSSFNSIRLALESSYNFKQNNYPNTNFEVYIPETETLQEVDVSSTPEAYHLLDFSSSIDINLNQASKLTVGLRITNVLDTSYRNYLNRLRLYADDLGRNFLLNLKINY